MISDELTLTCFWTHWLTTNACYTFPESFSFSSRFLGSFSTMLSKGDNICDCLLSCTPSPTGKRVCSGRKEYLPWKWVCLKKEKKIFLERTFFSICIGEDQTHKCIDYLEK